MKKGWIALCALFAMTWGGCTPVKIALLNTPKNSYHKHFATDPVAGSPAPFQFAVKPDGRIPHAETWMGKPNPKGLTTEQMLAQSGTTGFIVIHRDSIVYERYFGKSTDSTAHLSFSISKAVTSALVGIALAEGHFSSLEQPISDFIPELQNDPRGQIQLQHLINMTSGLNHGDHQYFIKTGMLFYNRNMRRYILKRSKLEAKPGTVFRYKSIDTQLLAMCLEAATGKRFADYLGEKLWAPIGPEHATRWCLDRPNGSPKAYGGLVATPRDLAKFGRLYMNGGEWDGKQIIPKGWVKQACTANETAGSWIWYSHCWWLYTPYRTRREDGSFYAVGYAGQVVYVNPAEELIIVRQGHKKNDMEWSWAIDQLANRYLYPIPAPTPTEAQMRELAGTYVSEDGLLKAVLAFRDGKLFANGNASKRLKNLPLSPEGENLFLNIREAVRATFDRTGNTVQKMVLEVYGRTQTLKRVRGEKE